MFANFRSLRLTPAHNIGDLARAAEFAPGWLVGPNIANRDKMKIIRAAAAIYELKLPDDLQIELPTSNAAQRIRAKKLPLRLLRSVAVAASIKAISCRDL